MSELISDVAAPESLSEGRSNPFTSPGLPEPVTILEETPDGRPPQPGIWGSIAWTAAMPLGQLVIGMPIGLFIVLLISAITGSISSSGQMTALITGTQIGTVAFALVAAVVCSRFARHAMFPLAPIRILHLVALVAMVLPATMLSRTCYDLALALWNAATASLPALRAVDEMNTMEQIGGIVGAVPFPLLLLLLAVVPAVAEEIIFRGIIGRGLTARYGLVSGIIMTSMLFGIAHGHPAHAVSVIPLGIVMHVLYVATRSIWAPMLFHFCNNAFAIVGAHVLVQRGEDLSAEAAPLPWYVAAAGFLSVAAWFWMLARSRTQLVTTGGSEWDPGYESTETPLEVETHRRYPELPFLPTLAAGLGCVLFFAALFVMGLMNATNTHGEPAAFLW